MLKLSSIGLADSELPYLIKPTEQLVDFTAYFNNSNPLHIEIGCGNGHFINARAKSNPKINFIGIDKSTKRIIKSIYKVKKCCSTNVIFFNGYGKALLEYIADNSIEACYLNFPDPWPKRRHRKNRIVNNDFLLLLNNKLKKDGYFIAASDHKPYFFEILDLLEKHNGFKNAFQTRYLNHFEDYEISLYEEKWRNMGRDIYFLKFIKDIS